MRAQQQQQQQQQRRQRGEEGRGDSVCDEIVEIMRIICDVCENAAAVLFCAADEAALCRSCDYKVHMCNKLASRHVRVGFADPSDVPRCDICENASAFFYCEIDGTSLCLQCDMVVHVGRKRTHGRYLLLRQRVEFPGDKPGQMDAAAVRPKEDVETNKYNNHLSKLTSREREQNNKASVPATEANGDDLDKMDDEMIDLNMRPYRTLGQAYGSRSQGTDHRNNQDLTCPIASLHGEVLQALDHKPLGTNS